MKYFDSPSPLLHEIFALHGKWLGKKAVAICQDQQLTWQQLTESNTAFCAALQNADIAPNSRIVVLMSNGLPMLQTLMGVMAAGCASVPINLSVSDEALKNMVLDSEACAVITTGDQAARIESIRADIENDVRLFVTTSFENLGSAKSGWQSWDGFLDCRQQPLPVSVQPDDVLNIIYSSGTTGLPKGIQATHGGRRDWAYDLSIALRYHSGARTLITIGMYSNITWVAMLSTLLCGGTLVIQCGFDAHQFLHVVEEHRITHTAMVPIQFQRVIEQMQEGQYDVSSMQAMMSCGSPLHESLKKDIFAYFPCGIIELYGLTEGVITTLAPEDAWGRFASVGKPLLGTDIKIIGADDVEVQPGASGEIVSRGRITMPGYHNRPDANQEATWLDADGNCWLRTGDIGYIDEEGFLYIVDRKKDMILSGGQNIYPQDIEAVLFDHPAVNDVAVIGAKSLRWGETPVAIVVPEQSSEVDVDEVKAWCNSHVGKQQRVADVVLIDMLPRNPNGKILKRELREQFKDRVYHG